MFDILLSRHDSCFSGPVCKEPIDLAFILDESGSIINRNWGIMKKFTETLIRSFDISDQGTHVAAVMFSNDAEVLIRFNDFTGPNNNVESVARKVRSFPRSGIGGRTYINKALDLTNTDIFTKENGMRGPDVQKVRNIFCFFKRAALCCVCILRLALSFQVFLCYPC